MCIRRHKKTRRGAGMVEYGLVVGLIAVGAIISVEQSGKSIRDLVTTVASDLSGVSDVVQGESATSGATAEASSNRLESCVGVYQADQAVTTGVYAIDSDGDGTAEDQYCDFGDADLSWALAVSGDNATACGGMSNGGHVIDNNDYILQAVNFQGYAGFPTVGPASMTEAECVQACEALGADACRQNLGSSAETCQAIWNVQLSGSNWRSTTCS